MERRRELGCRAEAAPLGVERAGDPVRAWCSPRRRRARPTSARWRRCGRSAVTSAVAFCSRSSRRLIHTSLIALDHLQERRLREVRAAPERSAVGVHDDGHRPAAATGERLHGVHVDRVDVGSLLAVDLDVDERGVHRGGDLVVLEALVGHDVAPVAGRVARPTAGSGRCARGRRRTPRRPTGTSRPGCHGADAGTGWSRRRADWSWLHGTADARTAAGREGVSRPEPVETSSR